MLTSQGGLPGSSCRRLLLRLEGGLSGLRLRGRQLLLQLLDLGQAGLAGGRCAGGNVWLLSLR